MSRMIAVEYTVQVYCYVDLDEGVIDKIVEDVENVSPTGEVTDADGSYTDSSTADAQAAIAIADEQDWPSWTRGY
jgi:hypothetical protein